MKPVIFVLINLYLIPCGFTQGVQYPALKLSKDTINGRMNLILTHSGKTESIAEFPQHSRLIDYNIKSHDSISVLINSSPAFIYMQLLNKNVQWEANSTIPWVETLLPVGAKSYYKLESFDKVIYVEDGKIRAFDLNDLTPKK